VNDAYARAFRAGWAPSDRGGSAHCRQARVAGCRRSAPAFPARSVAQRGGASNSFPPLYQIEHFWK
jgi:hypothetical protein